VSIPDAAVGRLTDAGTGSVTAQQGVACVRRRRIPARTTMPTARTGRTG